MAEKKKIVIIDTHIQTAVSISTVLEFKGFETFQAYNAEDGENLIISEQPLYAIVNTNLDGSSEELIKKFPKQKFILVCSPNECNKIKAKNIKAKLQKPIDNEELLSVLK